MWRTLRHLNEACTAAPRQLIGIITIVWPASTTPAASQLSKRTQVTQNALTREVMASKAVGPGGTEKPPSLGSSHKCIVLAPSNEP